MKEMLIYLFICVCLSASLVQAIPVERLLLHDEQSVAEKFQLMEDTIIKLNASLAQALTTLHLQQTAITDLRTAVTAESRERCQVGVVNFHDCHPCNEHVNIAFNPHFTKPPSVVFALQVLDVDASHNLRVGSGVSQVTTSGAVLSVNTWADTHLYGTSLSWMACPHA